MWLSEQKPAMFAYKLKSFYCPSIWLHYITMHVPCLHWLLTGLLFQSVFANHVNLWLVKCHQWRALIWKWRSDTDGGDPTVSTRMSRPCSGIMAPVDVDIVVILNSTICVILLLCFSLCHHLPHTHTLLIHTLISLAQYQCIPLKNHQKLLKINHYSFAR